ncbi:MAG: ACP S-malonyltransferase [Polyangiaceae bacterium]
MMSVAWLFPGQGSQVVGMGKDAFDASPAARAIFQQADDALDEKLSKLIFEGPIDQLTLTANAQPALVTVSCALLATLKERIPNLAPPAFAAGHSLGEYSALVAAGALTLGDAVRLVRARGQAMQEAVPAGVGAMAAVMGLDSDPVRAICKDASIDGEIVSPANFNAPGQIVIAGHKKAVARASELVSAQKGKAIQLNVSAPFHCALMAPAARVVEEKLKSVDVKALAFPIIANVDAQPNRDPSRVKDLLIRQVDGPVRWEESIRFMHENGITKALEIGPGKVLAGLARRIAKEITVTSVSDVATVAQAATVVG